MNLQWCSVVKRPIPVKAFQLTNEFWFDLYNKDNHSMLINGYELIADYVEETYYYSDGGETYPSPETRRCFFVNTLEDVDVNKLHKAEINDWLVQGVFGEIYPCAEGIFSRTYQRIKENINEC